MWLVVDWFGLKEKMELWDCCDCDYGGVFVDDFEGISG